MKIKTVITAIFFMIFLVQIIFPENIIMLSDSKKKYKPGKYLRILNDKKGIYTIENINIDNNKNFYKSKNEIPIYGLTNSVFWVNFKIKNNSSNRQYLLEFTWPLHDSIQLYKKINNEFILIDESGDIEPFHKRKYHHRNCIFYLTPEIDGISEYVLRFQSKDTMNLNMILWDEKTFLSNDKNNTTFLGFFFGIFFIMICYNLLIFSSTHEKSYLYYTGTLVFYTLFEIAYSGIGFAFLWGNFPWLQQHALSITMGICLMFFMQFTRQFLNISIFSSLLDKIIIATIIITFLILIISTFLDVLICFYIINPLLILCAALSVTCFIIVFNKGYTPAIYYFFAFIPFIIFTPTHILHNMSIIPPGNFFILHSVKLCMIFQVIILSLAIGNKINIMRVERIKAQKEAISSLKDAEKQLETFLLILADAIESKDTYTGGHVERVAKYSREIAKHLEFPENVIKNIYLGAIVHDVGKIGINNSILNKKGKLTWYEYEELKLHPINGYKLLKKIKDIDIPAKIALYHQEKWNGTGYPYGLKGKDIPIEARIVAIADYWDAIITDRPYRKRLNLNEAIEIMEIEKGITFDPEIFDIFIKNKIYLKFLPDENLLEHSNLIEE